MLSGVLNCKILIVFPVFFCSFELISFILSKNKAIYCQKKFWNIYRNQFKITWPKLQIDDFSLYEFFETDFLVFSNTIHVTWLT